MNAAIPNRHTKLSLALLGLLAANLMGTKISRNFEARELASTDESCHIADTFKQASSSSLSCPVTYERTQIINRQKTSFEGELLIKKIKKKVSLGSDNPAEEAPAQVSETEEIVYRVSVLTTPRGCDLCESSSQVREFIGKDYDSYSSLEADILKWGYSQAKLNVVAIKRAADQLGREEAEAKAQETKLAERLRREELCLIQPGGELEDPEVELKGIERLRCNESRLIQAQTKEEAESIYHSQMKADLINLLTKGSEEERLDAKAILENMKSGNDGQFAMNPYGTIRGSIIVADQASRYYDSLAVAQTKLAEARTSSEQMMYNQQVIGLRQQVLTYLSTPTSSKELSEDFQIWTKLFSDAGVSGIYNSHLLTDSRSQLNDLVIDMQGRTSRSLNGDVIFNQQSQFSEISVPQVPAGYMNNINQKLTNTGFGTGSTDVGRPGRVGTGTTMPQAGQIVNGAQ